MLKGLLVLGVLFIMAGCGEETDMDTSSVTEETKEVIDESISNISQELSNTLAYMGNEERLAYDVYNALYVKFGNKTFNNIATNGEYEHIASVQKLIQKYKYSDDVSFTNVDLEPLGYMNTPIEEMVPGVYDVSAIQDMYDSLMAMATNEIEALKVGCRIEVIDIIDLTHDIALAEAEEAKDIAKVFTMLRAGSYNHYWAFDKALQNDGGCCPTALEIIGGTECPDYPQK